MGFDVWVERVAEAIRFLYNSYIGGVTPLAKN